MSDSKKAECRACGHGLSDVFVDLGMSPLCESYVQSEALNDLEKFYPLKAWVCANCWLVQLEEYVGREDIFSNYDYLSSYSTSWVEHAGLYVEMIADRLQLDTNSSVVEVASNDGYLLQHFVAKGIPCMGIEPAENIAEIAREKGIKSITKFFGNQTAEETVEEFGKADLILGNNVLAHVPDLHDFVSGLKVLLEDDGVITMEFPHLVRLYDENQYDTIYHEHFCYFSFFVIEEVFRQHGLRLFDVDEIPTHGGSLRIYACHIDAENHPSTPNVTELRERELALGYSSMELYAAFEDNVQATKRNLLEFLIESKRSGKSVAGFGAPGKGNTLLNYCGIRTDFLDFTVDSNPLKQGAFTPGTHIPILAPSAIKEAKPDYVLILPWNLRDEISAAASYIREWDAKFVVPIPDVEIF